jgi:uncharacterized OB-fold protein
MTDTAKSRAIDATLFDWPAAQPALKASSCRTCGALQFPALGHCRSCGGLAVDETQLPRRGTLWAWTIQRFMPKAPYRSAQTAGNFTPWGLGYIELAGALCIESRLTQSDPQKLQIGAQLELVICPQWVEEDGTAVMNFAFKPV